MLQEVGQNIKNDMYTNQITTVWDSYGPAQTYYGVFWIGDSPKIFTDGDNSPIDAEEAVENNVDSPIKAIRQERENILWHLDNCIKHCSRTSSFSSMASMVKQLKRLDEVEADLKRGCELVME